jgi:hypothetical protein
LCSVTIEGAWLRNSLSAAVRLITLSCGKKLTSRRWKLAAKDESA